MVTFQDLPTESLVEIFYRLPAQDSFAWGSVCKSFRNVQLGNAMYRPRSIILSDWEDKFFRINMVGGKIYTSIESLPLKGYTDESVVKACNGMVCITHIDAYAKVHPVRIHDPATNFRKRLPVPQFVPLGGNCGFGFGFDSVNMKYKVIFVHSNECHTTGGILTLGEETWRMLTFPRNVVIPDAQPVFWDGDFYWLIDRETNPSRFERVLVFNIVSEKFDTIIRFPESLEKIQNLKMIKFGESVGIVESSGARENIFQIWRVVGSSSRGRRVELYTYHIHPLGRQFKSEIHIMGRLNDGVLLFRGTNWINVHHSCNRHCSHIGLFCPLTETGLVLDVVEDEEEYTWGSLFVPNPRCSSKKLL